MEALCFFYKFEVPHLMNWDTEDKHTYNSNVIRTCVISHVEKKSKKLSKTNDFLT